MHHCATGQRAYRQLPIRYWRFGTGGAPGAVSRTQSCYQGIIWIGDTGIGASQVAGIIRVLRVRIRNDKPIG